MAKGGYRGGMPMGGMNQMQMMKRAQKMQEEMLKMQEEMQTKTFEAAAGGGVVKAEVNGQHELKALAIDPEAVDPEDVEMLQDLIIAAVNEAMRKADEEQAASMSKLTGGLNLGGLF
ncbi:MAG: YbaB/EbfC family nucleoid-associated protein [Oscillospiraceae bacterium]|nr:YbaB/EbfC family nucleoid-associated protein [Oscillospiraceae bacterium]MBR2366001.1 YbaB/EbfC family nucleoid-associated protein [Oscillospiraceae bacterium]MBR2977168.1 YbaB/EbfC family nucleoid-associated protein [Oscillospiraceae bacterium]MBR3849913.1 YbaB/EbfC family nucleoid-associated protein [Oscillospiraceae bacterium]